MVRRAKGLLIAGLFALTVGIVGLFLVAPALTAAGSISGGPVGSGGMMGPAGMMGGPVAASAPPIGIERALANARSYVAGLGDPNLQLSEVMEFSANYYAQAIERSTGTRAFELLIDKYSGAVYPEMGPNMVWNTKYGMMGGMMRWRGSGAGLTADMTIGPAQAQQIARQYFQTQGLNLDVGEPDRFYGYYTLHTLRNREIEGMMSVNGYTGAIWYHTWHGPFVREVEVQT